MKKTGVYLRVSTEEQRERHTIATQRRAAERYLQQQHGVQVQWYEDNGVSGMIPLADRPAGGQLLHDAREGVIDRVVVYKLDRLGRDPLVILTVVSELEALHITLESITETLDHNSPSGKFLLAILSAAAGLERDVFLERSIEGTNRLAQEGAWLGGIVPYGYRVVGKQKDARLRIADERIEGCEYSEADIVRLIYHLTVEENKSCFAIATHLNELGIPPVYVRDQRTLLRGKRQCRTSGKWTPGRVRNMIVNTTYKGVHYYGRRSKKVRDVIERAVPAIVEERLWGTSAAGVAGASTL